MKLMHWNKNVQFFDMKKKNPLKSREKRAEHKIFAAYNPIYQLKLKRISALLVS